MPEGKIKEAFEAWKNKTPLQRKTYGSKPAFIAGYMACLNSLEYAATLTDNGKEKVAYFLPEGVVK